jgi:hypothetical protein
MDKNKIVPVPREELEKDVFGLKMEDRTWIELFDIETGKRINYINGINKIIRLNPDAALSHALTTFVREIVAIAGELEGKNLKVKVTGLPGSPPNSSTTYRITD